MHTKVKIVKSQNARTNDAFADMMRASKLITNFDEPKEYEPDEENILGFYVGDSRVDPDAMYCYMVRSTVDKQWNDASTAIFHLDKDPIGDILCALENRTKNLTTGPHAVHIVDSKTIKIGCTEIEVDKIQMIYDALDYLNNINPQISVCGRDIFVADNRLEDIDQIYMQLKPFMNR